MPFLFNSDGIPVTMSLTGVSDSASSTTAIIAEEQVNDASTTNAEMEDVKTVLNGTQTATSEEEN